MSSSKTGLSGMLADAAISNANRKKGREHIVGPQIWPVVRKSSPMDLTRTKDTLLQWTLSSLLQFHPERMLWLYSKVDDVPENRHEAIELLASAPHAIAIAKIVAENRNICFDAASYGPCLLSTSPEFRRLWSLLEAEISTMVSLDTARQYVKSGSIDHQLERLHTIWPPGENNLVVNSVLDNYTELVRRNKNNILGDAILRDERNLPSTEIQSRRSLIQAKVAPSAFFERFRFGDGFAEFEITRLSRDLLFTLWTRILATPAHINVSKQLMVMVRLGAPPAYFAQCPNLISLVLILASGDSAREIGYVKPSLIVSQATKLRALEVLWEVLEIEFAAFAKLRKAALPTLPPTFPQVGRCLGMLVEHARLTIQWDFEHEP